MIRSTDSGAGATCVISKAPPLLLPFKIRIHRLAPVPPTSKLTPNAASEQPLLPVPQQPRRPIREPAIPNRRPLPLRYHRKNPPTPPTVQSHPPHPYAT